MNIEIHQEPVAKGRPRFRVMGKYVTAYTPAKTKNTERLVIEEIKNQFKEEPYECPLAVWITFYFVIPKSYTKKKRKEIQDRNYIHISKPDCDNLAKLYLDAMNGIVYHDDAQIQQLHLRKFYSETEQGSVHIQIERLL